MPNLNRLREQRGEKITAARAMLDKAGAEKRDLNADETVIYDQLIADQENLRAQIVRAESLEQLEREAATREIENKKKETRTEKPSDTELQLRGFRGFLRNGANHAGEGAAEFRALQANRDPDGGYLVTPQEFVNSLIKFVDDAVFIRGKATKYTVATAQSLGAPSLDADPDDADWTAELATGAEDNAIKFGKRELHPHPLAKRIKISNKLLRQSTQPVEQWVRDRLGYKFGVTEEKSFMTGNGANKPLGIFSASNDGIPTSRDISTGNTTTAITFDGLLEAKYSLKGPYWGKASWTFHRDALKQLAKIKDADGQYIWQQAVVAGQPDRIFNMPIDMSEFCPNTFTTGQYVGALCDWSHYWIVDALDFSIQRLVELYAETNQTGLIGRAEVDGMPVLAEAFTRVKLA